MYFSCIFMWEDIAIKVKRKSWQNLNESQFIWIWWVDSKLFPKLNFRKKRTFQTGNYRPYFLVHQSAPVITVIKLILVSVNERNVIYGIYGLVSEKKTLETSLNLRLSNPYHWMMACAVKWYRNKVLWDIVWYSPSQSDAQFLGTNCMRITDRIAAIIIRLQLIAYHILVVIAECCLAFARIRQRTPSTCMSVGIQVDLYRVSCCWTQKN